MRDIHLSDECTVTVQGSPWAVFIYISEFTDPKTGNAPDWYKDYQQVFLVDDEDSFVLDVPFLLRTCWAMAKNHDESIPSFTEWVKTLDCSVHPSAPWIKEVLDAVRIELFCLPGATGADGTEDEAGSSE